MLLALINFVTSNAVGLAVGAAVAWHIPQPVWAKPVSDKIAVAVLFVWNKVKAAVGFFKK